jgi:hypothetical protein
VKRFVKTVVSIFSDEYLRLPNNDDIARLLVVRKNHGFLGILGSINWMHWKWKNCPTAWRFLIVDLIIAWGGIKLLLCSPSSKSIMKKGSSIICESIL